MHPGMHIPCSGWPQCFKFEKIGEMVLVDGLISTYTSFGEMVLVDGLISTYTSFWVVSIHFQVNLKVTQNLKKIGEMVLAHHMWQDGFHLM